MRKIKTLKKNYEFKNVLSRGKFYIGKQIHIYILKNNKNSNVIGIAVSTKECGAVQRNRIKRLIRENYRLIKNNLKEGYDIVFLWNKKERANEANYYIIKEDMQKIFKKSKLLEE
jgi:ribonuclease P protein component